MRAFGIERASDPRAAVAGYASHLGADPKFIAGGTNLVDLMKLEVERPGHLVDVNRLALDRVETGPGGGLEVGALVRNSVLAADPRVRAEYAVLSRALLAGASAQLRNRATTGGNLLQRTRCLYFNDVASACNKRVPGSGCDAIGGINRGLAVIGTSPDCIATFPGDMAVAMRLLDAEIHTLRPDGSARTIPIAEFHRLPGDTPQHDTVLGPGELIVSVTLPPPLGGVHRYRKVRDRSSYAFALVSVAAVVTSEGGVIRSARFAFGGIAPRPWRVEAAEALLAGRRPDADAIGAAADVALRGAQGFGQNDFKVPLARRTLAAVLRDAVAA